MLIRAEVHKAFDLEIPEGMTVNEAVEWAANLGARQIEQKGALLEVNTNCVIMQEVEEALGEDDDE